LNGKNNGQKNLNIYYFVNKKQLNKNNDYCHKLLILWKKNQIENINKHNVLK
jgi:hypothetical protein